MNIEESNRLIAEFMGESLDKHGTHIYLDVDHLHFNNHGSIIGLFEHSPVYHKSWDWLMPVVDKIHHTGCVSDICFRYDMGYFTIEAETEQETNMFEGHQNHGKPIDAVYSAVVEFIKWYNENKNI